MQTMTCSVKKESSQLTMSNFKQTFCEKNETIIHLINRNRSCKHEQLSSLVISK